ncbi:Sodium:dicarboxylate symporter family-domain-containing protein [Cokeromyces recurvatus]|uniref:Sodium:dicarboxylate symporter family-domain-containing protein n=1 Tax=Cokeromyces recurvatus TaxID=90255 RepID=UPI0022201ECE|nr:Sodium:dicarboxylate symporter family-domain-containing protein [Cokeromyces recurvatus]KAI7898614.1 Sodium:dicarboxylate symporter family-domain-containing protein [Cokeromyces recurvatus]
MLKNLRNKFKSTEKQEEEYDLYELPPVEETKSYPPVIQKISRSIFYVWNNLLIKPFMFIWNWFASRTNLTFWIITSMVVGILIGHFAPEGAVQLKPLGDAFIRMIKIIETPLIFSTLVVGIAGHGDDVGKVGRLAVKTIIYFEIVTTFALAVGLIMANLIKPGKGVTLFGDTSEVASLAEKGSHITWYGELEMIIPENFFVAALKNEILGVVFCAAMFSCAMMQADKTSKDFMLRINSSLSLIMFRFVGLVMNYAPIGIGAALAAAIGKNGIEILANLGKLIGSLYASLAIFVAIILVPVMFVVRVPIIGFFKAALPAWLIAFSSASSESALPRAMESMRKFGCPSSLVAFVIPCGYSFNLDGTTLYLALASIFAAQAGDINLPIGTQLSIMGTLMLSSKGVAAIPRASLVILAATVTQYGLPNEAIPMIMGVDAIMDMARTSINVFGNCLGCCVMARIEGSFRSTEWREEEIERRRTLQVEKERRERQMDGVSEDIALNDNKSEQIQHNENVHVVVHDACSVSEKSFGITTLPNNHKQ